MGVESAKGHSEAFWGSDPWLWSEGSEEGSYRSLEKGIAARIEAKSEQKQESREKMGHTAPCKSWL